MSDDSTPGERIGIRQRITGYTVGFAALALQLGCGAVILFFAAATLFGTFGRNSACAGLRPDAFGPELELREPDMTNWSDARSVTSLRKMVTSAGMNADDILPLVACVEEINAATLDGTTFLLFDGLKELPPDALDAVMAHEVAHAVRGHCASTERFASAVGLTTRIVGGLLDVDRAGMEQASSWAVRVTLPSYTRKQESEADKTSIAILVDAGYGEGAMEAVCKALELMKDRYGQRGGGFLGTHPSYDERLADLQATQD